MTQSNEQGGFNERLSGILAEFEEKLDYDRASESIRTLIEKEVIGEDDKHRAWCGTSCDDTAHVTNELRAEQRAKLK